MVTGVSGALALMTLAGVWTIRASSNHEAYLQLAGLIGAILLAHGAAWLIARSRRRYDLAMWLIALVQMASAVAAPLFVAGAWFISLVLLAVIPIEIGVADRPERMTLFAALGLLGAAVMISIDLSAPANRLTILQEASDVTWLVAALLLAHMSALSYLLWRLRLRSASPYYTRLNLATQQSFLFIGISTVSILLVTGALILQVRQSQIELAGQTPQMLAAVDANAVQLTKVAARAAVLVLIAVVLAGVVTSRIVTRPIEALTRTASAVSAGRLDQRVEPDGPVETVMLAEGFNALSGRLRSTIDNLQDQVAQRTLQLETRVEQLATLNRITQAVA